MNRKIIIFVVIALFLIGSMSFPVDGKDKNPIPKKALKLEKKGDKATKKKEYEKAMGFYKEALEIYPEMDNVHYKIAYIFALNKKLKESIDELYLTLKINKENENAKKLLINLSLKYGGSLLKNKKMADANNLFVKISKIEGIKKINEKFINELNYWIGYTFFQLKKIEPANEYLLKFINTPEITTTFPNFFSTANYLLGLGYSQAGDVENSNKYMAIFADLNKDKPGNTYLGFARYILGMNNFNTLKEKIARIEKVKTRNNMKESKKKILELAKSEKGVEENLLFAIENNPTLEDPYMLLGNFYYLKNDLDNSIKYYKIIIEKFPESADIEIYKVFLKDLERQKKEK